MRKARRKAASRVGVRVAAASEFVIEDEAVPEPPPAAPQTETEAELAAEGPIAPDTELPGRSAEFGRLVHQLLSMPGHAGGSLAGAQALAPQFGLGPADAEAAAALADQARTLPEIAAAEQADLTYRELPFAVPLDGVLATGQIDLAYRQGGEWTLIDFKTAERVRPGPGPRRPSRADGGIP